MGQFHSGEKWWQSQFAMEQSMAKIGEKVIRSFMPDQHREFFSQLPFLLVGSIDDKLQPTASVITGYPGFISTATESVMRIKTDLIPNDPLIENLGLHSPVGILGIQPHTKRRNRMNGWVIEKIHDEIVIQVQQSFGNCAKYITERRLEYYPARSPGQFQSSKILNEKQIQLINRADTFFMATAHPLAKNPQTPDQGVDVSHRGGQPGFVKATESSFRFPDYSGNFFFNSFGNIKLNPKVGFIFFDYESGDILQIDALVKIDRIVDEDRPGINTWCQASIQKIRFFSSSLLLNAYIK